MFTIDKKLIITWMAFILWMALIFAFSSQPSEETNHLSISVSQIMLKNKAAISLGINGSTDAITMFNSIIRKFAHFFLYFILGLLLMYAIGKSGVHGLKACLLSALVCAVYAAGDELHQWFVPGREASVMDIFIDTAGAAAGILTYMMIAGLRRQKS